MSLDSRNRKNISQVSIVKLDNGEFALGFIFEGVPYPIPHCLVNKDNRIKIILGDPSSPSFRSAQEFLTTLKKVHPKSFRHITNSSIPKGQVLLGYDDVNKKAYLANNGDPFEVEFFLDNILSKVIEAPINTEKNKGIFHFQFEFNENVERVYAKVAFNVLAKFKGIEFAQHANFDDFRRWLVSGENTEKFHLPLIRDNHFQKITQIDSFPELAHWCVVFVQNDFVYAMVSFYNTNNMAFCLGKTPFHLNRSEFFGMVCDWKNKHEETLARCIEKLIYKNFTIAHKPKF